MSFAAQLKAARNRLGLTQAEASAYLEVSKRALEQWEAGTRTPLAVTQEGALARLRRKPARQNSTGEPPAQRQLKEAASQ